VTRNEAKVNTNSSSVREGRFANPHQAAKAHNVDYNALRTRLGLTKNSSSTPGSAETRYKRLKKLTDEEEKEVANYFLARRHDPLPKSEIAVKATEILKRRDPSQSVSQGWIDLFLKRQHDLRRLYPPSGTKRKSTLSHRMESPPRLRSVSDTPEITRSRHRPVDTSDVEGSETTTAATAMTATTAPTTLTTTDFRVIDMSGDIKDLSLRPGLDTVRFKLRTDKETRYMLVKSDVELEEFLYKIRIKLGIHGQFKLHMKDEGDMVTIGDQEDLNILLALAKEGYGAEPVGDLPTRYTIVILKAFSGKTNGEIASITGRSVRSVERIYKSAIERGFNPDERPIALREEHVKDAPRSGRPPKMSQELKEQILESRIDAAGNAKGVPQMAQEWKQKGLDFSTTTIWRMLKLEGLADQHHINSRIKNVMGGDGNKSSGNDGGALLASSAQASIGSSSGSKTMSTSDSRSWDTESNDHATSSEKPARSAQVSSSWDSRLADEYGSGEWTQAHPQQYPERWQCDGPTPEDGSSSLRNQLLSMHKFEHDDMHQQRGRRQSTESQSQVEQLSEVQSTYTHSPTTPS
ncbi:hypothetical protein KEM56_000279, partial [Ascosphaera pollenicola]